MVAEVLKPAALLRKKMSREDQEPGTSTEGAHAWEHGDEETDSTCLGQRSGGGYGARNPRMLEKERGCYNGLVYRVER